MNEEEIKQTFVPPRLLQRLGYRMLKVNREALVRTGTSSIRADLVFYDEDAPYLVVETKAPDKITGESILQAESYAILLHAPYFLVTDGRRWHWYQTGKDGGGTSKLLDYEILPRHGRSRFFLQDVSLAAAAHAPHAHQTTTGPGSRRTFSICPCSSMPARTARRPCRRGCACPCRRRPASRCWRHQQRSVVLSPHPRLIVRRAPPACRHTTATILGHQLP